MPRLPGARELVGFARKLHHHRRHFEKLEGAKHLLATRPGWGARITFTEHEHYWRLHVLNISDGRPRLEIVGIIKGRGFEPVRLKESEVSRVPPVFPARDVALGHAGGEPLRVRDHPIGEQAAAASASNAELFVIDVTALDHFI